MSSSLDCTTSSALSTVVSVTFGIIYGIILVVVSVYSWKFAMQNNEKFTKSSFGKKLKYWTMDVYKRRRCYLPITTHLADMITDIAVVVQFGELATSVSPDDCGINMWYLFGLSIFTLILYRTISAFLIYRETKSYFRLINQWLDFELFRTLYINYLCDKNEPCSPQRWITALEAAFESTPQALIQTIFLVKTATFGSNPIVVASLIFSLWSIISKIISDDRVISDQDAKYAAFDGKKCKSLTCISWFFVIRYLWRILDVSSRILIASLLWIVLGGTQLAIIIAIECLIIYAVCVCTKNWEFISGIVAIVISKSDESTEGLSNLLIAYRYITNLIYMGVITGLIYSTNTNRCWKCSKYEDREEYRSSDSEIFIIVVYCWIAAVIAPYLCCLLNASVFTGSRSNSRSIQVMVQSEDWKGIVEMQAYKGDYGMYKEDLLMLAQQNQYHKLIKHLNRNNTEFRFGNTEIDADTAANVSIEIAKKQTSNTHKLLFFGISNSGKSTILKQIKIIHGNGYSDDERKRIYKDLIESQIVEEMRRMYGWYQELREDNAEKWGDLQLSSKGEEAAKQLTSKELKMFANVVEEIEILWAEPAMKEIFENRAKLTIDDSSGYFFDEIQRIATMQYIPTDRDILLVRHRDTGIIEQQFKVRDSQFHAIDVGGQRSERNKWIHCFDSITAVIYVASLSCYDEFIYDGIENTENAMNESLALFDEVCNSRYFYHQSIILLLNKKDLFAEKIVKVPLSVCFDEFPQHYDDHSYEDGIQFIEQQFEAKNDHDEKQIFIHVTCATDKDNMLKVFDDVQHLVTNITIRHFTNNLL